MSCLTGAAGCTQSGQARGLCSQSLWLQHTTPQSRRCVRVQPGPPTQAHAHPGPAWCQKWQPRAVPMAHCTNESLWVCCGADLTLRAPPQPTVLTGGARNRTHTKRSHLPSGRAAQPRTASAPAVCSSPARQ